MDILLCPNNYYVFPTLALLESIFKHNSEPLRLHIIHSELTNENIQRLKHSAAKHNAEILFYKISPQSLGNLPTSIHITVEAYYRLLAYRLLPECLDKILYLDGDIIVNKSLEPLFNETFSLGGNEALFIACEGPGVSRNEWSVYDNLAIPHDRLYCNSGVLLMNLSAMRRELSPNIVWSYIAKNQDRLKYHDQDTINALFYDRIKYVDWHIWNQTVLHIKNKHEAKERLNTAAILHYAGSDKPWNYNYASWWMDEFWKYACRINVNYGYGLKEYVSAMLRRCVYHISNRFGTGNQ